LLDFSLPYPNLAFALFKEQLKLEKFANLSILDSTDERDRYLDDSLQFVLESCIDTVNGGFYIQEGSQYRYSALNNAVFACWLLTAGRALYSGELIQYGKLMIESVEKHFWNNETTSFHQSFNFELTSAPFILQKSDLKSELTDDEFKLLEGYLNSKIESELVNCQFKNRLVDAAKFSDLFLKQAQILDGNLRLKLQKMSADSFGRASISGELSSEELTQVFSCMSQSLLWHQRDLTLDNYESVVELVVSSLDSKIETFESTQQQIQIVFSLFESFQLNLNQEYLKKLRSLNYFSWEKYFNELSDYSRILCSQIVSILEALSIRNDSLSKLKELLFEFQTHRVEFFDKSKSETGFFENYRKLSWNLAS